MWQEIAEQKLDGFIIRTYVAPEDDIDPAKEFEDEDTIEAILSGRLEWFQVKITASKCGVELGSDFLGGCCYESFDDFLGCEYWSNMVETAITEAREIIEELKK